MSSNNPTGNKKSATHVLVVMDGATEERVATIEIPRFDLGSFCIQFDVPVQYDPEMLEEYVVGPDDAKFLEQHLDTPVDFDFSRFGYWIEAVEND